MKTRNIIMWAVALLSLLTINFLSYQKEELTSKGRVVFLDLAPVDPRSLIQGDYMRLRYAISEQIDGLNPSQGGLAVVRIDSKNIAHFVRIYDSKTPLKADEILLIFRFDSSGVQVGPDSFFFQEGHAEYYEDARYGEVRVSDSGEVLLIGLRDVNLKLLGPPK